MADTRKTDPRQSQKASGGKPSPPRVASPPQTASPPRVASPPNLASPPYVASPPKVASPPRDLDPKQLASALRVSSALRASSIIRAASVLRAASAARTPSPPGQTPSPPRAASPALGSLVRSMAQPAFRTAFVASPARAVQQAGIVGLPQTQLDVLAKLSAQELEIVASVLARLREATPGRRLSL